MPEDNDLNLLEVLLISMFGLFILAFGAITFFVIYQRRLLNKEREKKSLETHYQKELLQATIRSQENERNRIARDLHDDVGVMLTTTKMYLGQLAPNQDAVVLDALVNKVNAMLSETIDNIRRIAHDLRPIVLENLGFAEAVESLAESINRTNKIHIDFVNSLAVRLDKESELLLYRIVQELIVNTIKHAKARHIKITTGINHDRFFLEYNDDGTGFLPGNGKLNTGLGMKSIESRLNILGGKLTVRSKKQGISFLIEADYKQHIQNHA